MKCPNCNNDVKDEMKFCPKCGSKVPQVRICPDCGAEVKEGMEFCSKCGKHINVQISNSTVSNPTRLSSSPTDQESSLVIEFEREIEQEKRKSMIKWGCIFAALVLGGVIWSEYNSANNSTSSNSISSSYSSTTSTSSDYDSYNTQENQPPKTKKKAPRETCWYCNGSKEAVTQYGITLCPMCHGTGFLVDGKPVW